MNVDTLNYLPIEVGDTISYTKEGTVETYGKVEKIIDCIEETFVEVGNFWINTNLVQLVKKKVK